MLIPRPRRRIGRPRPQRPGPPLPPPPAMPPRHLEPVMAHQGQDQDVVDLDPYDPGDGSVPVLRWRQADCGLATRRLLRASPRGSRRPGCADRPRRTGPATRRGRPQRSWKAAARSISAAGTPCSIHASRCRRMSGWRTCMPSVLIDRWALRLSCRRDRDGRYGLVSHYRCSPSPAWSTDDAISRTRSGLIPVRCSTARG